MGTNTKAEQIRAYNAQKAQEEEFQKSKEETSKTIAKDDSLSNKEKVQKKAEEKPKTQEEIDEEVRLLKEQEEQDRIDMLHQVTDATASLINTVNARVEPAKNWISSLQTPGGIASILVAIAAFALLFIPVNPQGETRAYLLWQTILGRTHMLYRESMDVGGSSISNPSTTSGLTPNFGGPSGGSNGNVPITLPDLTNVNLFGFGD